MTVFDNTVKRRATVENLQTNGNASHPSTQPLNTVISFTSVISDNTFRPRLAEERVQEEEKNPYLFSWYIDYSQVIKY